MSNVFDKITLNNTTHSTIITPSATTNITLTLPTITDTLVGLATTGTLTNKTLKSPIIGGSITAGAWGTSGIQSQFTANTYTDNTSAAGTVTNNMINAFGQSTITSTNAVTYTNGATMYIANVPLAGTNATLTLPTALQINNTGNGFGLRFTGTSTTKTLDLTPLDVRSPYFDQFANLWFPSATTGAYWTIMDTTGSLIKIYIDGTKKVLTANSTLDDGSGNMTIAGNITGSGQFKLTGTTFPNILFPTNNKILIGETGAVGDTSNTVYQIGSGSNTKNMILVIPKTNTGSLYIMHDGTNTSFANEHSGSFNFMSSGTYTSTNLATSISGSTQWASISSSGITSTSLILTNSAHTNTVSSTTLSANSTFNLPPTTGTNTQLLQTDGSGNTSWSLTKKITQTTFTSGSSTFTVPSGALNSSVTFWAGGGGGGGTTNAGGGGGGSYILNLPLIAGSTYVYSIGTASIGSIPASSTVATTGGNTGIAGNYLIYNTGTVGTGGSTTTTITGSSTVFNPSMVGGLLVVTPTTVCTQITAVANGTSMTVSPAVAIANSSPYNIYYGGGVVLAVGGIPGSNGGTGGSGGTAPTTIFGGLGYTGSGGGNTVNGNFAAMFNVGGTGNSGGGGGAGFNGAGGNGGTNSGGGNAGASSGAGGGGAGNSGSGQDTGGNGGAGGMIFTYWA